MRPGRACSAGCGAAAFLAAVLVGGLRLVDAQSCDPNDLRWGTMFPTDGGLADPVWAVTVYDGELYLGGEFDNYHLDGNTANYILRWNGRRWAEAGAGVWNSPVYAVARFYDPNDPAMPEGGVLYAGARDGVYRMAGNLDDPNDWWLPVATTNAPVRALAVYDGMLYAGGKFTCIRVPDPIDPWETLCDPNDPNQAGYHIARWAGTGSSWEVLGKGDSNDPNTFGMDGNVLALTLFDHDADGSVALFAGGRFTSAGGVGASRIAFWQNGVWAGLGRGVDEPNDPNCEVDALAGWNGSLYAGGTLTLAGTTGIAAVRYDPNDPNNPWHWSPVGAGVGPWRRPNGTLAPGAVLSLAVLDVDGTEALYAGGTFLSVPDPNDPNDPNDALPARRIAKWNGVTWSALSDGFENAPLALVTYDDGFGPAVYAGGMFAEADGLSAPKIARFKGGKWSPLGRAPGSAIYAFCEVTAWHRPRLFVGGMFQNVGDLSTGGLACWDGVAWSAVGGSAVHAVNALTAFDDGSGLDLFVGGGDLIITDTDDQGRASGFIARGRMVPADPNDPNDFSDCNTWAWIWSNTADPNDSNVPVSSAGEYGGAVRALAEFQDPNDSNPSLYAAGRFTEIGGHPARHIARLRVVDPNDPNRLWEEVGDPNDPGRPQDHLFALAVCPDISDGQPALYAGGIGGVYQWRDKTWSHVGVDSTVISSLAVYEDPNDTQPTLYAGGASYLKKWTADGWCVLDPNTPTLSAVYALHVYNDGRGPALYVGGWYPFPVARMGRWDGEWEFLANGVSDHVWALGELADGLSERASLYVGGHFLTAGNVSSRDTDSQFIARWGCVTACRGDLNHDGSVGFADINPFILALSSPAAYAAANPGLAETNSTGDHYTGGLVLFLGDLNCDGTVGFADINPFVQRVSEGCCSAECGPCEPLGERGMRAMQAGMDESGGELTPEDMAALLAGSVEPADYENLLARLIAFIAQQTDPAEAEYWEAVYQALIR